MPEPGFVGPGTGPEAASGVGPGFLFVLLTHPAISVGAAPASWSVLSVQSSTFTAPDSQSNEGGSCHV